MNSLHLFIYKNICYLGPVYEHIIQRHAICNRPGSRTKDDRRGMHNQPALQKQSNHICCRKIRTGSIILLVADIDDFDDRGVVVGGDFFCVGFRF